MFGNPKGIAALIVAKAKPAPEESEQNAGDEGLRAASEDLIEAVKNEDTEGVMQALTSAFQIVDAQPHEEGEHSDEDEEGPEEFAKGGKVGLQTKLDVENYKSMIDSPWGSPTREPDETSREFGSSVMRGSDVRTKHQNSKLRKKLKEYLVRTGFDADKHGPGYAKGGKVPHFDLAKRVVEYAKGGKVNRSMTDVAKSLVKEFRGHVDDWEDLSRDTARAHGFDPEEFHNEVMKHAEAPVSDELSADKLCSRCTKQLPAGLKGHLCPTCSKIER